MLLVVPHYGARFISNEHAQLIAQGAFNWIIWLKV